MVENSWHRYDMKKLRHSGHCQRDVSRGHTHSRRHGLRRVEYSTTDHILNFFYDVVEKKFTFAISSPDEFLYAIPHAFDPFWQIIKTENIVLSNREIWRCRCLYNVFFLSFQLSLLMMMMMMKITFPLCHQVTSWKLRTVTANRPLLSAPRHQLMRSLATTFLPSCSVLRQQGCLQATSFRQIHHLTEFLDFRLRHFRSFQTHMSRMTVG